MSRDRARAPLAPGFRMATVINFLLSTVFYLLTTTMAAYAADRFAADETAAGFASSAFVLGALVARLASGAIIGAVGPRRLYLASAAAAVLACGAYLFADALWLLITVRLVHGLAFGVAHSAIGAMAQSRIPPSRRGEGNGYFATAATVGAAVGPLLAVLLIRDDVYILLFAGTAIVTVCALTTGWAIPRRESDGPVRDAAPRFAPLAAPALPIGAVAFLQSLGYASLTAFLAGHAASIDAPASAGGFFLVYAVCVVAVRLVAGGLFDRFGPAPVMAPGLVLYSLGLLLLAFTADAVAVLVAAALIGFGYGALLPTGIAIASQRVGSRNPGGAYSTYFFFVDLGYGAGPALLGWVLGTWGWTAMLVTGSAAALFAGALYLLQARRTRRET